MDVSHSPTRKMMDPKVQRITMAHSGSTNAGEAGAAVAFVRVDMVVKSAAVMSWFQLRKLL